MNSPGRGTSARMQCTTLRFCNYSHVAARRFSNSSVRWVGGGKLFFPGRLRQLRLLLGADLAGCSGRKDVRREGRRRHIRGKGFATLRLCPDLSGCDSRRKSPFPASARVRGRLGASRTNQPSRRPWHRGRRLRWHRPAFRRIAPIGRSQALCSENRSDRRCADEPFPGE